MTPVDEQLDILSSRLGHLDGFRSKKMFGGASLYSEDVVFCLITREGIPHFRVGPSNLEDFKDHNQMPFKPYEKKGSGQMPYYTIPAKIMDDQVLLEEWAARAILAAKEAKK